MGIERLSIMGVGLLGGSIGLAVKKRLKGCRVVGYGHRPETLEQALDRGAIDEASTSVVEAVANADLVVLCTPVSLFEPLLWEASTGLGPDALVTDVGSTKRSVVEHASKVLRKTGILPSARFVGSHPMAGSEKRGVRYATAELFQNATCILTPTVNTDQQALKEIRGFWQLLGMNCLDMSPDEHDRRLADVSHLPHAVAAAMVLLQDDASLAVAGKGFMDATRIAGGDGGLWRDILLDNRDNMLASIDTLVGQLGKLSTLLKDNRGEELAAWLDQAAQRRNIMRNNEPRTK
jgi:prephenate dehydrogenase